MLWRAMIHHGAESQSFDPGMAETIRFLAFLAVGCGLVYFSLLGLVNRTTIVIGRDSLAISNGPLPSFKPRHREMPSLVSVRCTEESARSVRSRRYFNCVRGRLSDGTEIELDRVEQNEDQARWIEAEISEHLRHSRGRV